MAVVSQYTLARLSMRCIFISFGSLCWDAIDIILSPVIPLRWKLSLLFASWYFLSLKFTSSHLKLVHRSLSSVWILFRRLSKSALLSQLNSFFIVSSILVISWSPFLLGDLRNIATRFSISSKSFLTISDFSTLSVGFANCSESAWSLWDDAIFFGYQWKGILLHLGGIFPTISIYARIKCTLVDVVSSSYSLNKLDNLFSSSSEVLCL